MKYLWLMLFASVASAQTYYDKTTIPPTGATNTVIGNKTNATAAPTYMAVGTCSTSASALIWTTNTGFGCNTAIDAATLLTGTWAAPGSIGSGTPAAGAFTTLSTTGASSLGGPITLTLGTSLSKATWGTAGYGIAIPAATFNDTTVGSGTVAHDAAYAFNAPTTTNTQGTSNTLTNNTNVYFAAPVCGSGWAACTNNNAIYSAGRITAAAGLTTSAAVNNLNVSSNFATNINTGSSNALVTIGGGSNAVTLNATTATVTATTVAITGSTTNTGTLNVTGAITPSTTAGIVGTAAADQPTAGSIGEVVSLNCPVTASAAAASNVSTPVASPGVVTWASHTFVPSTSLANYTCPINFTTTGALPTGLATATTYYIIGSTVSGDTFQVADTAAHALAGTNAINFTGSTSGQSGGYLGMYGANGTIGTGSAVRLIAGDWDCTMLAEYQELTSLTTTRFVSGVDTSIAANIGNTADIRTASAAIAANSYYLPSPVIRENISVTTSIFGIVEATFSGGTMSQGGNLRCRRMR